MSKAKFVKHEDAVKSALQFRVSNWLDTNEESEHFGVEAQMKLNIWCHIAVPEGATFKVWLFDTEQKAKNSIAAMKTMQAEAAALAEKKAKEPA